MDSIDLEGRNPFPLYGCWVRDPSSERLVWQPETRETLGLVGAPPNPTFEEFLELVHPEDRNRVARARDDDSSEIVFRLLGPDGGIRVLRSLSFGGDDAADGGDRITGILYDVTRDDTAAAGNAEGLNGCRTLVDDLPALVCRYRPDGTLMFANASFAAVFGLPQTDPTGRNWLTLLSAEDRRSIEHQIAALCRTASTARNEGWIVTPAADRRFLSWTHRGLFDADGNLVEVQSIGLDATERKLLESQVFHLSKLRSLGEMAAITSHELLQPLSAILLAASNLVETVTDERDDDLIVRKLRMIISQSERLTSVATRMKAMGRPVSDTERRAFPLRRKAEECLELLNYMFGMDGVHITFDDGGFEGSIFGSPDLIDQILINLLMNARDAVVAAARMRPDLDPTVCLSTTQVGGSAVLRISDNGGGVADDLLPKLFEPFFTTKNNQGGTGLGLAICKTIVTQMNGSIHAFNEGDGLTVEVRIPLAKGGASPPAITPDP